MQIRPPNVPRGTQPYLQYEDKVTQYGKLKEKNIKEHCELVAEFAGFLSRDLELNVAFDQYTKDQHIPNKPKWLQENIANSDFAIFVITPSFLKILNEAPDEEIFFKGQYLDNVINELVKVKIVCVFLDRARCTEHIPEPLRAGNIYELWRPFQRGEMYDDLNSFVSLMKRGDYYRT